MPRINIPVVQEIHAIAQRTSEMKPLAYMQYMQTFMVIAGLVGGIYVYSKHSTSLEAIHHSNIETQLRVTQTQSELSNEIRNSIKEQTETRNMVVTHLLGLKRDADTIKRDIKEVKEQPKDIFGRRIPQVVKVPPEVLPIPEVVPQ